VISRNILLFYSKQMVQYQY